MLSEELIGDELTKAVIAALEVCHGCGRVSECLPIGRLATGYDRQAKRVLFKPIWWCWQCWGDVATASPEYGQGAGV